MIFARFYAMTYIHTATIDYIVNRKGFTECLFSKLQVSNPLTSNSVGLVFSVRPYVYTWMRKLEGEKGRERRTDTYG